MHTEWKPIQKMETESNFNIIDLMILNFVLAMTLKRHDHFYMRSGLAKK